MVTMWQTQDSFKNALSDKIGQALDDKRQSVATDWLNGDEMQATKDAAVLTADNAETPAAVEVDQGGEENADDVQQFKTKLAEQKATLQKRLLSLKNYRQLKRWQ